MRKDTKIGIFVTLVLGSGVILYLTTLDGMSMDKRILKTQEHNGIEVIPQDEQYSQLPVYDEAVVSDVIEIRELDEGIAAPEESGEMEVVIPEVVEIRYINANRDKTYYEKQYTTQRFHIVRKGESLWKISKKYYGKGGDWNRIYEANRTLLKKGPASIKEGMKLIIPR